MKKSDEEMGQNLLLAEAIDAAGCNLAGPMAQLCLIDGRQRETRQVCSKHVGRKSGLASTGTDGTTARINSEQTRIVRDQVMLF